MTPPHWIRYKVSDSGEVYVNTEDLADLFGALGAPVALVDTLTLFGLEHELRVASVT